MRPSKRDQIVNTALDLFYEHGFHATGIEKVLSGADVARMGGTDHDDPNILQFHCALSRPSCVAL